MSDFLGDERPLWARLGYASEAAYLAVQEQRAKQAKETLGQEMARQYAVAGRDYASVKKMRRKKKDRERARWRRTEDPAYRERSYQAHRLWCAHHAERRREINLAYYYRNRDWILPQNRARYTENKEELNQRIRHKRANDPEWRAQRQEIENRYRFKHPGRRKTSQRLSRARYRDKRIAYSQKKYDREHPQARRQGDISRAARDFESEVAEARSAGFTWKEISQLLGRSDRYCRKAFVRFYKRSNDPEWIEQERTINNEAAKRRRARKRTEKLAQIEQRREQGRPTTRREYA